MKKIMYAAAFACCVLPALVNLSGCKTTQVNIKEYAPVAIASVYCNPSMPWYSNEQGKSPDDAGPGALSNMVNKTMNANNPEYTEINLRIDGAAETIKQILEDNGVSVLDASDLEKSKSYQKSSIAWLDVLSTDVAASGYKALDYNGKSRNRRIATECGASSLLFAEFVFQKQKIPVGLFDMSVAARVTLKVYVCDSQGKKLLFKTYTAVSTDTTEYSNGSWDRQAVCNAVPSAVESVVNQFVMDYVLGNFSSSDDAEDGDATDSGANAASNEGVQSTSISLPKPAKTNAESAAQSADEPEGTESAE
ncbi:MAG: hypothetical protein IKR40_12690 [Treponema sp.]|nr:hypothetical protein [Treponema sp.]